MAHNLSRVPATCNNLRRYAKIDELKYRYLTERSRVHCDFTPIQFSSLESSLFQCLAWHWSIVSASIMDILCNISFYICLCNSKINVRFLYSCYINCHCNCDACHSGNLDFTENLVFKYHKTILPHIQSILILIQ